MSSKLDKLSQQLQPKGRAFRVPPGSRKEDLQAAENEAIQGLYDDAQGILDAVLPDNANFTADDATDWERRLGIPSAGSAVLLADRKAAIIRKLNHPGTIKARQNYRYIEKSLQAAGFDVHVYENRFDDGSGGFMTMAPTEVISSYAPVAMAGAIQAGMAQHGQIAPIPTTLVVNSMEEATDALFDVGDNYRSTFYIGGIIPWQPSDNPYADVPAVRKAEFRELIHRLKPKQSVAFLFINYT